MHVKSWLGIELLIAYVFTHSFNGHVQQTSGAVCHNAVCTYSKSDVLNHYTTKASPKKDAQVVYITLPDAAVHSIYGFCIWY